MSAAFLSVLKNCYHDAASGRYSERAAETVCRLDGFIVSGILSKSHVDQFILKNYKVGIREMTEKWNQIYKKTKKQDTFRGQYSLLSGYVGSVFGMNACELNDIFATDDEEGIRGICDVIHALSADDACMHVAFPELMDVLELSVPARGTYPVGDCLDELRFLKMLDVKNVRSMAGNLDHDKLAFLLQTIEEPLLWERYVEQPECRKKVKRAFLNHDKLELMKLFCMDRCAVVGVGDVLEKTPQSGGEHGERGDAASDPLSLPQEYADILVRGLEKFDSLPDGVRRRFEETARADGECYEKCKGFLARYGCKSFLSEVNKLNPYALREVLRNCLGW